VSSWQAVVFDLDDTLYPERDYVLSGFRAVADWADAQLRIPRAQGFAELQDLFEQGVRGATFDRWLGRHDLASPVIIARLVSIYREHTPTLSPFPGVPELLAGLRRRCRLGLLSDGYLGVQRAKLAALGLAGYFDAVIFSDAWGRDAWKPSPIPYAAALRELGVDAGDAVYVADNPAKDFLGARRAGLAAIRLHHPTGEHAHRAPPTPEHAPDFTVASFAALQRLLTGPAGDGSFLAADLCATLQGHCQPADNEEGAAC
jgi:putative hydrolase of the HAD superfamily